MFSFRAPNLNPNCLATGGPVRYCLSNRAPGTPRSLEVVMPHSPEIEALKQQLERLERSHHRLKSLCLVVLVAGASLLLMGQARPPRVIEGEKLILRDSHGNVRAVLESTANGSRLLLFDSKERTPKVELRANEGNEQALTFLTPALSDGVPQERMVLFNRKDHGGLHLFDSSSRLFALSAKDGKPDLRMADGKGSNAILSFSSGTPLLILSAPTRSSVVVGFDPEKLNQVPQVVLLDAAGKVHWSSP